MGASREEFDRHIKKGSTRGLHQPAKSAQAKGEPVALEQPITVRTLSAGLGIKANELIGKLMRQGVMANINAALDFDVAQAMALEYGIELEIKHEDTLEEELEREFAQAQGMLY